MSNAENKIKSLIAEGIISTSLAAHLLKDDEDDNFILVVIGTAIASTKKASEEARKTNIPQVIVEHGILYEIDDSREKRFIKKFKKTNYSLPERFKLS